MDREALLAYWWMGEPNFGDALNPLLIKHLSGRTVYNSSSMLNLIGAPVYSVIGSALYELVAHDLEVWGSAVALTAAFLAPLAEFTQSEGHCPCISAQTGATLSRCLR
jgi:predicted branched-subunit amino acid permease